MLIPPHKGGIFFYMKNMVEFEAMEQPTETKQVEWWILELLPKGKLVLLSAEGGTGKTSLAAYLAMELAKKDARVCYWSFEDSPQDFTNKGMRHYNISIIHTTDDKPFSPTEENITSLWNFLVEDCTDLLIIDPIAQLADGDINDNQKVRALLAPFIEMADQLEITILGIHHFRKPSKGGGGSVKHSATGAAAWVNSARHCLSLVKNDDGDLLLEVSKSNIAKTGTSWEVRTEINKYAYKVVGLDRAEDGAAQAALEEPKKKRIPPVVAALKDEFDIGQAFTLTDVMRLGNFKSFYNYKDRNPNEFQELEKDGKKAWIFI